MDDQNTNLVPPEQSSDQPPVTPVTPVTPEISGARIDAPPMVPPPTSYSYGTAAAAPQTNTLAIVGLVASILAWVGLFGLGGIVGVICGVIARNQIKESAGAQTGDGIAVAGIVIGAINIVFSCLAILCVFVAFAGLFTVPFFTNGSSR